MKTIIAGSRKLGMESVNLALNRYRLPVSELVCGCDDIGILAHDWIRKYVERPVPVSYFPACPTQLRWAKKQESESKAKFGISSYINLPKGGFKTYTRELNAQRDVRMVKYAEAVIAIWDDRSYIVRSLCNLAIGEGLVVTVFNQRGEIIR